jgi:hypothetical protein
MISLKYKGDTMKMFTNEDLRIYLLNRIYFKKYRDLANFLKTEISKDPKFDFFEYLHQHGSDVIQTAKDSYALDKRVDEFIKNEFKLMHYGILKRIKSCIEDKKTVY